MDIKTEFESSSDYSEYIIKREDFNEKLEESSRSFEDDENGCLSIYSKKINKKRKKYQKIDNEIRMKIVEEVQKNGKLLKNAAEKYNVNYSSAKSIFHVYRKEGRILKKPFKGRVSKTIVHLNNPIVFVNIPGPSVAHQLPAGNSSSETPTYYPPVWRQIPPIGSLTIGGNAPKDSVSAQFVSILHPKSASMLQNICGQPFQGQGYSPVNEGLIVQDNKLRSSYLDRKLESFGKINQEIPQMSTYPFIPLRNQMYPNPEKDYLIGSNGSSPTERSLCKASMLNHWVQNQLNTIQSRP